MMREDADMGLIGTEGSLRSRVFAAFSYLGILCFVPLLMNRNDEFVQFHARQGLVLWMWGVFALFTLGLPGIGKWFFGFSGMMIMMYSGVGLLAVLLEKAWKLPLICKLAERL
ncbi:Magnetosome protein MamF [Azospirillaceae bacterium]